VAGLPAEPPGRRLDLRHGLLDDGVSPVAVAGVERGDRRPRRRDLWRMLVYDARVLTTRTPEGPAEVAIRAGQVEWLRSRLAGTDLPPAD
jgi:hypothetical protein